MFIRYIYEAVRGILSKFPYYIHLTDCGPDTNEKKRC